MSKNQKGFIVYGDIDAVIEELNDEQVGQLFRGMVKYFTEGREPKFSGILKYVFIPIKQQMDRDKDKYDAKCEKNRENIKAYWERTKENERIRTNTNATNTKTKTDTDTKKDTDTDTTTNTDTNAAKQRGGGDCDDKFNIWKLLDSEGIDKIYDAYPESGGYLLDEVYKYVRDNRRVIKNPVGYVLGYAKKVGWDDNAEHFDGGGMA